MHAIVENNLIQLLFPYDYGIVQAIRGMPDRKYDPKTKIWTVPLEWFEQIEPALKQLECQGLDEVRVKWEAFKGLGSQLNELSEAIEGDFRSELPLYPFQRAIAQFMLQAGNSLNASFVGSGKTLTMLAVLDKLEVKNALIVCPKSVIGVWKSEIKKWLPLTPIAFTITNYEQVRLKPWNYSGGYDVIVCDEAHRLGNSRTQTYKSLASLPSKHRFGLTATPLMNRVLDLWAITNWLNPGVLGSFKSFADRYCIKNAWGGLVAVANLDELAGRLKRYVIRKTLDEVGIEMPKRVIENIVFDLSPAEARLMKQIKQELLFEIEKMDISKINDPTTLQMTIVKMNKLIELGDSMELLGRTTKSTKTEILKDHLRDTLVNGNKAVIFSRFERMVKILERELPQYNPLVITGAVDDRAEIIRKFQEEDENQIMIMTEAGGEGITLTRANYLYNIDLPWSNGKYEQRLGRIYRIGTTKPVFVYNLLARQSPDRWIFKKLLNKQALAGAVYGEQPMTMESIKESLTDEE